MRLGLRQVVGSAAVAVATVLMATVLLAGAAAAAELDMLCVGAMHSTMPGLGGTFKQQSGHTVKITFGAAGVLRAKAESGERADLIVLPPAGLQALVAKNLVRADSIVDLVHVGVGIAIRKGAPAPDVSTPETFKQALLAAPAVYFGDPKTATSAIHFVKMLERMGIAKEVLAKSKTYPDGNQAMAQLAQEQGIGVTQTSEILPNSGVQMIGPLPGDLQLMTTYSGAVLSHAPHPEAAQALLALLAGPEGKARFKAAGFEVNP